MRTLPRFAAVALLGGLAAVAATADTPPITKHEIAVGYVLLFDGDTTFGWKTEGDVAVKNGKLVVGGPKGGRITTTAAFSPGRVGMHYKAEGGTPDGPGATLLVPGEKIGPSILRATTGNAWTSDASGWYTKHAPADPVPGGPVVLDVPPGMTVTTDYFYIQPKVTAPLFNGKDLTGWKVFDADPAKNKATFTVTPAGELHVKGGPGDIQTERKFADFVLQTEVKTAGPTVNAGIFFRCVPGQMQNGYECQIQNGIKDGDRTKPLDFGTGAIYRRVPARKVVSSDDEWFTLTLVATGPHISTWVNGYQVVDWTDDRPKDENPRKGLRTEAGHISIQGHAPPMVADALIRNVRIAEVTTEKK